MQYPNTIIIGGGMLSSQIEKMMPVKIIQKHEFNLITQKISSLAPDILNYDVIVITAGINHGSVNDIFCTNFLGPIKILEALANIGYSGRVILVGSHAATWPSWPGIDLERLSYNLSKRFLREFVKGLAHSEQTKLKLTVFEPTKFQSKMSQFQGIEIQSVAKSLIDVICSDNYLLHVELN